MPRSGLPGAPTDLLMGQPAKHNIVFVTSEPFGAYHIAPLARRQPADIEAVHLLPYPSPPQPPTRYPVVNDARAITEADAIVVTGGLLSAWATLAVCYANSAGVPVIYVELANTGNIKASSVCLTKLEVEYALFATQESANNINHILGEQECQPTIIGTPQLDFVPEHKPVSGSIVAFSGVTAEIPDENKTLRSAVTDLQSLGWQVALRCHPREPKENWGGFVIDESPDAASAAASSEYVIGYPGTASFVVASIGVPVLGLATEKWMTDSVPQSVVDLITPVTSVDNLGKVLSEAVPPDRLLVEKIHGPPGATAKFWSTVSDLINRAEP